MEKLHVPDTSVVFLLSCSVVQLSWHQSNQVLQDRGFYALQCAVGIGETTGNKSTKKLEFHERKIQST